MKNIIFMKVHEPASVAVVGASNKKFQSFTEEICKYFESEIFFSTFEKETQ
jgi:hypothetical protein